jgi:hypothetical protein
VVKDIENNFGGFMPKKRTSESWVCEDCKKKISKEQRKRPWIIDIIMAKDKYINELLEEIEKLKKKLKHAQ